MSKTKKKSYIIIAIVIILFIIICLVYETMKTKPVDANNTNTNLLDENTGLDNIINKLFDDVTTNEEVENEIEENIEKENTNTENNEANNEDTSSSESVTSKQEKAINLVKKEWGGDDGVYFSNESIDSQGRYIVSVRDKRTTNSLAFFLVDVDRELVTKQ